MVIDRGDGPARERLIHLERLLRLCRDAGAPLMVSRRVDLALACGADGVHLPGRGLDPGPLRTFWPNLVVGRSCHRRAELEAAARAGAAYALLSPVAPPHSKPASGPTLSLDGFAGAIAGLDLPVFALGGITAALAPRLRRRGAAGVAALGGVLGADEPGRSAQELIRAWDGLGAS